MWINDKASSSTLGEVLASHDHKRHAKINYIHEETKLTIKQRLKRLRHDKSRVFALYGASQCRVYKRKTCVYNNNYGFFVCWQISLSTLDRNQYDRARGVFKVLATRHLMMALGFQLTWACTWSRLLGSSAVRSIAALVHSIALPGNSYILLLIFHPLTTFLCQWPTTH